MTRRDTRDDRRPPWAHQLAAYRRRRGLTIQEAARRFLEHSESDAELDSLVRQWGRWEGGQRPTRQRRSLAAFLGVPVSVLMTGEPSSAGTPHSADTVGDDGWWEDDDMRRRHFLRSVAGLASVVGMAAIAPGSTGPKSVGMADVNEINGLADMFRAAAHRYGGGSCLVEITTFADRVSTLLHGSYTDTVGPRLHSAVATLRDGAGWAAFDVGDIPETYRHWREAEACARAAGDLPLAAHIRYNYAREAQDRGDWAAMHQHLTDALNIAAPGKPTATTLAMLLQCDSLALAHLGRDTEAQAALGEAEETFARRDPAADPSWAQFLNDTEFGVIRAMVHRELGRRQARYRDAAAVAAVELLPRYGPERVRSRTLATVNAARAAFVAGEPGTGVELARTALEYAEGLESRRVHGRLTELAGDLAPHTRHPDVRDLATRILAARG